MSSPRFTIVVRSASLKISRSSIESSSSAANASIASATETRIPLLRSRFVNSRIFFCIGPRLASAATPFLAAGAAARPGAGAPAWRAASPAFFASSLPSSLLRLPDVALVLEDHVAACRSRAPRRAPSTFSASSARAQSSVSLIDGVFFRSSLRSRCITPTSSSASRSPTPGTLGSRIAQLELLVREVDVEVQAAALERVGHLARVVRGEDHERHVLRLDRAELGHAHLEVREHLEQERLELRVGLVDLVDQQQRRLVRR